MVKQDQLDSWMEKTIKAHFPSPDWVVTAIPFFWCNSGSARVAKTVNFNCDVFRKFGSDVPLHKARSCTERDGRAASLMQSAARSHQWRQSRSSERSTCANGLGTPARQGRAVDGWGSICAVRGRCNAAADSDPLHLAAFITFESVLASEFNSES
jgi:hypothetical protein